MAINYLIKWVEDLEETFVNTKDFAKALAVKETSDYFKTDHYKEKVINLRSKVSRTRITSIVDIIELIKGLSKDTDLPRMFAIEQAISFVDNFEDQRDSVLKLMKAIDKHIRIPTKSKVFEKLGIKYTVKRSNTMRPGMQFSDLFENDDAKTPVPNIRNWNNRLPLWKISYCIPIESIRIRDTLKNQSNTSFDFKVPYNGKIFLDFTLQCLSMHKFFFGNITRIEHYLDNIDEACLEIFNEPDEEREYRWFRDATLRMSDNLSEIDNASFDRFSSHVHPYMTRPTHLSGEAAHYCTGDLDEDLNLSYRNLEFEKLGLVVQDWLSNFIIGHTGPLNNINHFLMAGVSKDCGKNVGQYHLNNDWQIHCYETYMKDYRLCDSAKCAFRSYCEPYNNAKGVVAAAEFSARTIEGMMKKHEKWLIYFNTSGNYDINHRTEIENVLVNSQDSDHFNLFLEEMNFDGLNLRPSEFEDLQWYFMNRALNEPERAASADNVAQALQEGSL